MKRASEHFLQQDHQRITDAVKQAESKTCAEFMPVVATSSGRYDRPEDMVGLWLGGAAVLAAWAWVPAGPSEAGDWSGAPVWLQPTAMALALVAGFFVGAVIADRIAWLRRLFTPAQQMADAVDAASRGVFFDQRVHHTEGATGVLIYVSLFERRAAVIADAQVIDALRQEGETDDSVLGALCGQVTERLKSGDLSTALAATITDIAQRIQSALPRSDQDVNELPDALITID